MNDILSRNRQSWDSMADSWFGATALPVYGCLCPTEDSLHLFPDLQGRKVLDVGCGSGHSLAWCASRGAKELWGLDLSARQLENARKHLQRLGLEAALIHAPMETYNGLPTDYFDVVYAVYSLGWSTDLPGTMRRIAACLKPGGTLIFSWDHPLMHCVEAQEEHLAFTGSYTRDEVFSYVQRGQPVTVHNHRLSTWLNALADAGLRLVRMVEETDPAVLAREAEFSSGYYSEFRARQIPLSMIIKAEKP